MKHRDAYEWYNGIEKPDDVFHPLVSQYLDELLQDPEIDEITKPFLGMIIHSNMDTPLELKSNEECWTLEYFLATEAATKCFPTLAEHVDLFGDCNGLALLLATYSEHLEMVRLYVTLGVTKDDQIDALYLAIEHGSLQMVRFFVEEALVDDREEPFQEYRFVGACRILEYCDFEILQFWMDFYQVTERRQDEPGIFPNLLLHCLGSAHYRAAKYLVQHYKAHEIPMSYWETQDPVVAMSHREAIDTFLSFLPPHMLVR